MGIRISRNWLRRRFNRPTIARFRNRRGVTHYEHRRGLAPTPRRRSAVRSLVAPPFRRKPFDSSPRVRPLCRGRALLEHRARWRVRSGASAQFPPRECGGPRAPSPGYLRSFPCHHHTALRRPNATGGHRITPQLDLRVVAATNKNLREAVKEGAFRQDLYFRLNVIQIVLPPMRERPEDILPLAHDWPGNARELRNAIERAMILEESAYITPSSLPNSITRPDGQPAAAAPRTEIPTEGLSLEDNERMLLARALEKTGGNQTQAARLLRITRDTLRYKMKKFNLR